MLKLRPVLFVILLINLAPAYAIQPDNGELARIIKGLPQDIAEFAGRADGCYIWSHVDNDGNESRDDEIRSAVAKLKCSEINDDRKKLEEKYKGNELAKKALTYIAKKYAD